jgi:hypothetical protein
MVFESREKSRFISKHGLNTVDRPLVGSDRLNGKDLSKFIGARASDEQDVSEPAGPDATEDCITSAVEVLRLVKRRNRRRSELQIF